MAIRPQLPPIDVVCVERSERQLSALREFGPCNTLRSKRMSALAQCCDYAAAPASVRFPPIATTAQHSGLYETSASEQWLRWNSRPWISCEPPAPECLVSSLARRATAPAGFRRFPAHCGLGGRAPQPGFPETLHSTPTRRSCYGRENFTVSRPSTR